MKFVTINIIRIIINGVITHRKVISRPFSNKCFCSSDIGADDKRRRLPFPTVVELCFPIS